MQTTSKLLVRLALGAALGLTMAAAMASIQVTPPGNTFDTPNGVGTFQSGSMDMSFSPNWMITANSVQISLTPIAPTHSPILPALEGMQPGSILTSPLSMVSVDGTLRTLNGAVGFGGMNFSQPTLNALSTSGNLSITDMYADLNTGTVYGSVNGANGVGSQSGVALWQAKQISGSSSTANPPPCVNVDALCQTGDTIITHAELQGLALTTLGQAIFQRSLGLLPTGQEFLNVVSNNVGTITVNAVFSVPTDYRLTPAGAVPEPSTWALMGLGLIGLCGASRRKAHQELYAA
jgi:hypothetical protein